MPPSGRRYVLHDVDVRLLGNSAFIRKAMKTRCNPKALVSLVHYMSYNNVQFSHDMCFTVRVDAMCTVIHLLTALYTALYTTTIWLLSHGMIVEGGEGVYTKLVYEWNVLRRCVKALCPSS